MLSRRRLALAALVVTSLATRTVLGDPGFVHLNTPSHVVTDGGADLRLPPGYFLDEPDWKVREDELKRLQDQETRLGAENKSLRETASGWQPGWKLILGAVVVGLGAGWYLHDRL